MTLYEKTNNFLMRTIMKTPLRFLLFLALITPAVIVFAGKLPQVAMVALPLAILLAGLYVMVVSIMHTITVAKRPAKCPKFCDKCFQILPDESMSKDGEQSAP